MARLKEKLDPHANKLYFLAHQPTGPNKSAYYSWVLKDYHGARIGMSIDVYPEKISAVRNAIALFGREIFAGEHKTIDPEDQTLVMKEVERHQKLTQMKRASRG